MAFAIRRHDVYYLSLSEARCEHRVGADRGWFTALAINNHTEAIVGNNYSLPVRFGHVLIFAILVMTFNGAMAVNDEVQRLDPCPQSPNCVCSDEPGDSSHYIAPLVSLARSGDEPDSVSAQRLLAAIVAYIEKDAHYRIVEQTEDRLVVEARTRFLSFVDDVEFQVRSDAIFVRSASRLGYSDFGKNRRRMEAVRTAMVEQGVAKS